MRLSDLSAYDLLAIDTVAGECVTAPRGTFKAIFDNAYLPVGEIAVESATPKLEARTCDVESAGVAIGAALGIEGDTYIVRSVQHDGMGLTVLILEGP
jgi:hypothetical protein